MTEIPVEAPEPDIIHRSLLRRYQDDNDAHGNKAQRGVKPRVSPRGAFRSESYTHMATEGAVTRASPPTNK